MSKNVIKKHLLDVTFHCDVDKDVMAQQPFSC